MGVDSTINKCSNPLIIPAEVADSVDLATINFNSLTDPILYENKRCL